MKAIPKNFPISTLVPVLKFLFLINNASMLSIRAVKKNNIKPFAIAAFKGNELASIKTSAQALKYFWQYVNDVTLKSNYVRLS